MLGCQGKALPIDESDVEDQNALVFTEIVKGHAKRWGLLCVYANQEVAHGRWFR